MELHYFKETNEVRFFDPNAKSYLMTYEEEKAARLAEKTEADAEIEALKAELKRLKGE